MKRSLVIHALCLSGCVWLTACQKTLEVKALSDEIKSTLEKQATIKLKQVFCPDNIPMKANQAFTCIGELESAQTFAVNVRQLDDQGKLEWEIPFSKAILDITQLEQELQKGLQERGIAAKVNCGDRYRLNRANDTFECQFDKKGIPTPIVVQTDASHNITWQEILPVAVKPAKQTATGTQATPAATSATPTPAATTPANSVPTEVIEELEADQRGDD